LHPLQIDLLHPFLRPPADSRAMVFAHRGYSANLPENSMAAFSTAVALGVHCLETDAQLTSDGVVIAFHDADLARLTGISGPVSNFAWPEIASLRINGQEPIPQLAELFAEWPGQRINIDAKQDEVVRPLLEMIEEFDAWDRVCIGSFSDRRLRQMRRLAGTRLCTSMGPQEVVRLRMASLGCPVGRFRSDCAQLPPYRYHVPIVDRLLVRAAHARNLPVHVWTVNDADEIARLLSLGVDGIMSDDVPTALGACTGNEER